MNTLRERVKENPDAAVRALSQRRLMNFARYIQPSMDFQPFHKTYYKILNEFAHGKIKKLIVQMPPQHGKSEGSSRKLPAYLLGLNPDLKIVICCYAARLAEKFNRDVQRIIDTDEYRELFPGTLLNYSSALTEKSTAVRNNDGFEVVNRVGSLRTVGRGGALTGNPVDIAILDDIYKDPAEGNSPVIREGAWDWYTDVVLTRLHNRSQQLIVFTRWHEDDLIGRIEQREKIIDVKSWDDINNIPEGAWVRINFSAVKVGEPSELDPRQEGTALWEDRHSLKGLLAKRALTPLRFECLYQGTPSAAVGRLYNPFRTYTEKSEFGQFVRSGCYVDVADEGNDMLCAICYDIYKSPGEVYDEQKRRFVPLLFALITDIVLTDEGTEKTTITVPAMINRNNIQKVWVESNNGGAMFAKSIRGKIRSQIVPFHQSANKESRVITASAMVNTQIIFPFGWENRFPVMFDHVTKFQRDFKSNKHDDPEDAITGIFEKELIDGFDKPYSAQHQGIRRLN